MAMLPFMLFVAIITTMTIAMVSASEPKFCNDRTSLFSNYGNVEQSYFFIAETYNIAGDPNIAYNSNTQYREQVEARMTCRGVHCIKKTANGKSWGCVEFGDTAPRHQCYEVEHIIPRANTIDELSECSAFLDISGNFVMAYGKWNGALSNKYYGEKQIIYGDIWDKAYAAVYTKCKGHAPTTKYRCPASGSYAALITVCSFMFACSIVTVVVYLIIKNYANSTTTVPYHDLNHDLNDSDIALDVSDFGSDSNTDSNIDEVKKD